MFLSPAEKNASTENQTNNTKLTSLPPESLIHILSLLVGYFENKEGYADFLNFALVSQLFSSVANAYVASLFLQEKWPGSFIMQMAWHRQS